MDYKYITLNNGIKCPTVGLGTWKSDKNETKNAVIEAIKNGYRHIDCAASYGNEIEVGEAINECVPSICKREELFITTKLWKTDFDPSDVEIGIKVSLKKLGLDYIDLYLVHGPIKHVLKCEKRDPNDYMNWTKYGSEKTSIPYSNEWFFPVWREMEKLVEKGLTKSIGISNWSIKRIEELLKICKIIPAMNQVELHPALNQSKLISYCHSKGIHITAYAPLGSPDKPDIFKSPGQFVPLSNPIILKIAEKYKKTPAQILLRWSIQRLCVVIPKSANKNRIKENINIFDFNINDDDMNEINKLNTNNRIFTMSHDLSDPKDLKEMFDGDY